MTGLAVASFLAFGALLVLFGSNTHALIEALGIGYADIGLLGSCLSLGLGIGIVIAGPLVDRLPRRPLFVAACGTVLVACVTLGPGTSFHRLLFHAFLIGFGAGVYETVLNALVIEEFGAVAPRRLLFIHAAATLAASLTPLFLHALRELVALPWYDTFHMAGALHGALIFGVAFVPMEAAVGQAADVEADEEAVVDPAAEPVPAFAESTRQGNPSRAASTASTSTKGSTNSTGALAGDGDRIAFAAICLATFAYVGVESALTLFVADHARTDLGLDAARAARTISAFWGGLLIGRLAVGLSPRAPGAGTTAALASIAALVVLGFGLGVVAPPELAMATAGFFLGGVFPVMIGLAGQALPRRAGLAVGLAGGLGSLGGFVIPWITGRLAAADGLASALTTLSAWLCLLVTGAAFARMRRRPRKA